jgi:hypothetical protein
VKGKAEEVGRSDERKKILDLLKQAGEPLTPGEIAELLDKHKGSTRTLLFKMRDKNEVALFGKKYQLPDYEPPEQSVPSVPKGKKTGNAPKVQNGKKLDKSVPSVPSVPRNAQEGNRNNDFDAFLGTLGTRERSEDKPSNSNGLDAFPVKNGIGNAGNAFEPPTDHQNIYDAIDR